MERAARIVKARAVAGRSALLSSLSMTFRTWCAFALFLTGCARATSTENARLPSRVAVGPTPVVVYGVRCLSKPSSDERLCAVLLDETERVRSQPESAAASETIHGSTVSTSSWFARPEAVSPQAFTLISPTASRVVSSAQKVVFYTQQSSYGGSGHPSPPDEGTTGYLVAANGTAAIAGAHANVRYMTTTTYSDALASSESVRPGDRDWQKADPSSRELHRADFRDEYPGGYRVDGVVTARLEKQPGGGRLRCVSFNYVTGDVDRGTFPCATIGPPRGILVVDGAATWVFTKGWGT